MNNNFFFEWYQEQLKFLMYEGGSLIYLFSQFVDFKKYSKEWAENCLDFSYRMLKCDLCIFYGTNQNNIKILDIYAQNDPCGHDGYAIWESYELITTQKGESFLKSCGLSDDTKEFSPLLKEKLSALFDEYGVGFDKSKFIPVQF